MVEDWNNVKQWSGTVEQQAGTMWWNSVKQYGGAVKTKNTATVIF